MKKDERTDQRIFLLFYLEIYCNETKKFIGSVMDLSSSGMRLCCRNPVKVDEILNCRMILPVPPMECQQISFKSKAVWCETAFNPNYYDIGTQFLDLEEHEQKIIEKLIEVTVYDHCWPTEDQTFPMEY
ncbi:MAG: PilZ domain-containing protein [Candidatus Zixiibacteriota bacterium]|nr:MAG: PilZ domain-containing protein [candidate division Zixibacteria bacterium]